MHRLDTSEEDNYEGTVVAAIPTQNVQQQPQQQVPKPNPQPNVEIKMTGVGLTPVAVSTTLPAQVVQLSQQGNICKFLLFLYLRNPLLNYVIFAVNI